MTIIPRRYVVLPALLAAGVFSGLQPGCSRSVTVEGTGGSPGGGNNPGTGGDGPTGAGGDGPAGMGGASGGTGASSGNPTGGGGAIASGSGGARVDGGNANDGGTTDWGLTGNPLIDEVNRDNPTARAAITQPELMVDLTDIQLPAVGSDGVSILQYAATGGAAIVVHADWSGQSGTWYGSSAAHYLYTAANGTQHVNLLYLASSYPIFDDGANSELSGTPSTYKEFLTANANGFAWVDYEVKGRAPGTTTYGKIVFQTWAGARTALTDALRYRARPDISSDHVVFVEYASTAPGAIGQVMAQPLATGGAAVAAATSAHHQDRPTVDGNWMVWEEYLTTADSVIRARNLSTGEVRDISATVGFRTNPDIKGTRVIWEDQRSGNGDIYLVDLTAGGERLIVSGGGHSSGARLTPDGLAWTESAGGKVALLRSRWAP